MVKPSKQQTAFASELGEVEVSLMRLPFFAQNVGCSLCLVVEQKPSGWIHKKDLKRSWHSKRRFFWGPDRMRSVPRFAFLMHLLLVFLVFRVAESLGKSWQRFPHSTTNAMVWCQCRGFQMHCQGFSAAEGSWTNWLTCSSMPLMKLNLTWLALYPAGQKFFLIEFQWFVTVPRYVFAVGDGSTGGDIQCNTHDSALQLRLISCI